MKKVLLVLFLCGVFGVYAQHPTANNKLYVAPNSDKYKILSVMIDLNEYEEFVYWAEIDKVKAKLLVLKEKFYEDKEKADAARDELVKERIEIRRKAEFAINSRDNAARDRAHDYITAPGVRIYKNFREQIISNIEFALDYENKVINKLVKDTNWYEKQLRDNSKLTLEGIANCRENIAKRQDELKKRYARCRKWQEIKSDINNKMPVLAQAITDSMSATE